MRPSGLGAAASRNPLMVASSDLLILLGRLRTGLVEARSPLLHDHVAEAVKRFGRDAAAAGADPEEASAAQYALAATADDIMQNLPGADREAWNSRGMTARFFQDRDSGVHFFERARHLLEAPGRGLDALEVILTCLLMGFEGRYRSARGGEAELVAWRRGLYEALRDRRPRPDGDLSPRWAPVPMAGRRLRAPVPLWSIAAIALAMVGILFAALNLVLTREADAVKQMLGRLNGLPAMVQPAIEARPSALPESLAPAAVDVQLERIRASLRPEVEADQVAIDPLDRFIRIRLSESLRFGSGSATLGEDAGPLLGRVALAIVAEPGSIQVVGYTDSAGDEDDNLWLSQQRADAVRQALAGAMAVAAGRLTSTGAGETQLVRDGDGSEDQEASRRVEILVSRERAP